MSFIWAAISLGLVSNFHCLGMCGPIALAVPVKSNSTFARIKSILSYNCGRIVTYGIIGAIFGLFGQGISLVGFQQQLAIIIGLLFIVSAVLILFNRSYNFLSKLMPQGALKIQSKMGTYLRTKGYLNNFILGLLNGILPCGLVYFALIGAMATSSIFSGVLFMVFFGIGTLPVMVLLPWIKDYLTSSVKQKLQKLIPVFLIVFGVVIVLRGANLGIPFLSPKAATSTNQTNPVADNSTETIEIKNGPRMECCQSGSSKEIEP